MNENQVT